MARLKIWDAVQGAWLYLSGPQVGQAPIERRYTTVGANTWTKPVGLVYAVVEVLGGGGAGGGTTASATAGHASAGASGGAGAYARRLFTAADLAGLTTATATVGAGGTGSATADGNDGGTSSFAGTGITTISCPGGNGGARGADRAADTSDSLTGPTAVPTGGDFNTPGMGSIGHAVIIGGFTQTPRGGDAPPYGVGGQGVRGSSGATATAGNPGQGYGAGGSGAQARSTATNAAGGAGAPGIVIVTEYYQ